MDPSYNAQPISSGTGDIILNSNQPKKSKKWPILIIAALLVLACLGFVIFINFNNKDNTKTLFLEYLNDIQKDDINIEEIDSAYQKYYAQLPTLSSRLQNDAMDYNQIYQFFRSYQHSLKPTRADIATKYIQDGKKNTEEYFLEDYRTFKDKKDEYSVQYYKLRTEQLDILLRLFDSYDEAGCLSDFVSGKGCANNVNIEISNEEYTRLPEIEKNISYIAKLNKKDLLSGANDMAVALEAQND